MCIGEDLDGPDMIRSMKRILFLLQRNYLHERFKDAYVKFTMVGSKACKRCNHESKFFIICAFLLH